MSIRGKLLECAKKDSVFEKKLKTANNMEKTVQLKANLNDAPFHWKNDFIQMLDDNIIYINLCASNCAYENFTKEICLLKRKR